MKSKSFYQVIITTIALALFCLFICTACQEEYQYSHGNIKGAVIDATTGLPISLACNISVQNIEGNVVTKLTTDTIGKYKTKDLAEGVYTVTIEQEAYATDSKTVQVKPGEITQCDFSLNSLPARIKTNTDEIDFGKDESNNTSSFRIVNNYLHELEWYIGDYDCKWISSIKPNKGTLTHGQTETIIVMIDRTKLSGGVNKTTIVVTSKNGQGVNITITATGKETDAPVLNVIGVSDIDKATAVLSGEIVNKGIPPYTRRGFTCSLSSMDDNAKEYYAEFNDNAVFTYKITGLTAGKKYYVRAFAIINESSGKVWSANELTFNTIESYSKVRTDAITGLDLVSGSCTLNGYVEQVGNPVYSKKGFCISNNSDPTINDIKYPVSGSGDGTFSYLLTNLETNTTYKVCAYIIQNGRVSYGEVETFKTNTGETSVTTSAPTNVTPSSATLNGAIIKKGSPGYSEKGFCYSKTPSPSISNTMIPVSGTGEGNFSKNITGLEYNTTYYYKAYAIQNGNVIYGSEVNFNTGYTQPVVETSPDVQNILYNSAKLSYIIKNLGEPKCTEVGVCYGTSSSPTISSDKDKGSIVTYNQYVTISDLEEGTNYYYRAYAIQGGVVVYGTTYSFKTATRPSVSTLSVSNIQNQYGMINMWEAQLNGTVNKVGDPAITGRGFKYSSHGDPESGGTTEYVSGSTEGAFSVTLYGLDSNTTYYVRAYVKNSMGYEYGELVTFQTGD